jgi:membrane protease subunit (stomatin/prohibitin family)
MKGAGMAKGWKCARCSTSNDDAVLSCSGCGMIRGSVVPANARQATRPVVDRRLVLHAGPG